MSADSSLPKQKINIIYCFYSEHLETNDYEKKLNQTLVMKIINSDIYRKIKPYAQAMLRNVFTCEFQPCVLEVSHTYGTVIISLQ